MATAIAKGFATAFRLIGPRLAQGLASAATTAGIKYLLDANGNPVLDANGNPVPDPNQNQNTSSNPASGICASSSCYEQCQLNDMRLHNLCEQLTAEFVTDLRIMGCEGATCKVPLVEKTCSAKRSCCAKEPPRKASCGKCTKRVSRRMTKCH
jgi:hypothetical protein